MGNGNTYIIEREFLGKVTVEELIIRIIERHNNDYKREETA